MSKKLAIKGHSTRGKEVIELLEMMGKYCPAEIYGMCENRCYFIKDNGWVGWNYIGPEEIVKYKIFTLEEFLEKYPLKVGDNVFDITDEDPGIITAIKWDEDVSDMKYRVDFDNGDMGWYTNDTIGFLNEDKNLEEEKNMNKKLVIKGHPTRGKEVIKLLEMMGGHNGSNLLGNKSDYVYFITDSGNIGCKYPNYILTDYFTLEEFLDKYPFKVGDKVFLYDNISEGCVTGMKWDEDKGTVKYCVYTSSECWCDVKELLKWNTIDLVERHYMDNMEEKDKAKAPDIKGEDYSGKRFGYKIPDGYEFDVVVDGKIFLKPIKPKYPKTYDDCYNILNANEFVGYELITNFPKLINARNAYWKIAGEEMGLGKPWKYDMSKDEFSYAISYQYGYIQKNEIRYKNAILVFPTKEMRDTFYKNFKDLIEECKELL